MGTHERCIGNGSLFTGAECTRVDVAVGIGKEFSLSYRERTTSLQFIRLGIDAVRGVAPGKGDMSSPEADYTVHGIHRTTIDSDVSNSAYARTIAAGSGDVAAKAMATELALRTGSADEAAKFVNMAAALSERRLRARELDIKARAQETKDEQLKLAREKFEAAEKRLNAVQGAVDAPQLTDAERVAKIKDIFGMK